MIPAPGTMLDENLRLLRLLGRGGMGSVWLAEHLVLKHEVAVKVLSPELTKEPEALERFRKEATAVAQLKSPHVVQIFDLGTTDGTPYFVMERLEGEDLSHRLKRVKRLPLGTVGAIVAQTCKALARVHELGVVHRDLKPGNIFLTDVDGDLIVKLLDFGVAKTPLSGDVAVHQTSDQSVLGTPLYMSPEQILSPKNVSPATDLWALGVVAYECLGGRPPFDGETIPAIHVAIASGKYAPISTVNPSVPRSLDAWFARALASSKEHRFRTAREMADAFLAAARGDLAVPIAAPEPVRRREPTSLPAVTLPPPAQHGAGRFAAPIAAGALVLALAAVGLAAFGRSRTPTSAAPITATSDRPPSTIASAPPLASGPAAAISSSTPISTSTSSSTSTSTTGEVPAVPASALPNSYRGGSRPAVKKKDRGF